MAPDTNLPIREAIVEAFVASVLNEMAVGRIVGRSTRTDDEGNFEFKDLQAGSYRLTASTSQFSAQYLAFSYGANGPALDPGTAIKLSDGETFDKATIVLPRGSVIAGRVTDDGVEPMARVQVSALWFPPGSAQPPRRKLCTDRRPRPVSIVFSAAGRIRGRCGGANLNLRRSKHAAHRPGR